MKAFMVAWWKDREVVGLKMVVVVSKSNHFPFFMISVGSSSREGQ